MWAAAPRPSYYFTVYIFLSLIKVNPTKELEEVVECFRESYLIGVVKNWIALVEAERSFFDDMGRRACVGLFIILGSEYPVTDEYRRRLCPILF